MTKRPDKPGFYWARSRCFQWWNLFVQVTGEAPYLSIDFVLDVYGHCVISSSEIHEFGPEIVRPDNVQVSREEK